MIILQILGGILLFFIILALVVYFYFRIKFGKYLHVEPQADPLTIHLVEDIAPDWLNNGKVKEYANQLAQLGYQRGAAYSVREMDGTVLCAHFKGPAIAALYQHDIAGVWVDFAVEDQRDGIDYTFTNAPMGGGLEQRPDTRKTFDPSASVASLNEQLEAVYRDRPDDFLHIQYDEFRQYFEDAYKKDMAWKNRKGGISREEFARMEEEAPFSTSDKNIELAYVDTKNRELEQWHEVAIEAFEDTSKLDEGEFYELSYKLLVVPFTTDATAFIQYLEEHGFVTEEQQEKLTNVYKKETDTFKLFEKINDLLSPELRATKLHEADFPLQLKIYQMSEEMMS